MTRQYPTYRLGPDFRHKLTGFVDRFLAGGYAEFEKEFANIDEFICRAWELENHPEQDIRRTPKEKYLLEAVSFKIYDELNRKAFNATDDTLIVLPDCDGCILKEKTVAAG